MGLASGKSKLKLIDIEQDMARGLKQGRRDPALGPKRIAADEFPAANDVTKVGATLRAARESAGQDLRDASRALRIRWEYLNAIEEGDFKPLPGMTYAIGYVRSYAQHLDLDVECAVTQFKAEARDLNGPRQLVFPSPAPEGKVPGGALMFVAALLAVFAYAGWYHLTNSGSAVAGYTVEVPQALQSWLDEKTSSGTSEGFTTAAVASSLDNRSEGAEAAGETSDSPLAIVAAEPKSETAPADNSSTTGNAKTPAPEEAALPSSIPAPAGMVRVESVPAAAVEPATSTPAPDTQIAALQTAPAEPTRSATANAVNMASPGSATTESAPSASSAPSETNGDATEREDSNVSERAELAALTVHDNPVATDDGTTPATTEASGSEEASSSGASESVIPSAPAVTTASPVSDARPEATQTGAGQSRVLIRASAASWVQVRAADSTTVMTKVMRVGDIYEVPERAGLKLFTGNAGALTILIDGKAIPQIGALGHVARNIDLSPEILEKQAN